MHNCDEDRGVRLQFTYGTNGVSATWNENMAGLAAQVVAGAIGTIAGEFKRLAVQNEVDETERRRRDERDASRRELRDCQDEAREMRQRDRECELALEREADANMIRRVREFSDIQVDQLRQRVDIKVALQQGRSPVQRC